MGPYGVKLLQAIVNKCDMPWIQCWESFQTMPVKPGDYHFTTEAWTQTLDIILFLPLMDHFYVSGIEIAIKHMRNQIDRRIHPDVELPPEDLEEYRAQAPELLPANQGPWTFDTNNHTSLLQQLSTAATATQLAQRDAQVRAQMEAQARTDILFGKDLHAKICLLAREAHLATPVPGNAYVVRPVPTDPSGQPLPHWPFSNELTTFPRDGVPCHQVGNPLEAGDQFICTGADAVYIAAPPVEGGNQWAIAIQHVAVQPFDTYNEEERALLHATQGHTVTIITRTRQSLVTELNRYHNDEMATIFKIYDRDVKNKKRAALYCPPTPPSEGPVLQPAWTPKDADFPVENQVAIRPQVIKEVALRHQLLEQHRTEQGETEEDDESDSDANSDESMPAAPIEPAAPSAPAAPPEPAATAAPVAPPLPEGNPAVMQSIPRPTAEILRLSTVDTTSALPDDSIQLSARASTVSEEVHTAKLNWRDIDRMCAKCCQFIPTIKCIACDCYFCEEHMQLRKCHAVRVEDVLIQRHHMPANDPNYYEADQPPEGFIVNVTFGEITPIIDEMNAKFKAKLDANYEDKLRRGQPVRLSQVEDAPPTSPPQSTDAIVVDTVDDAPAEDIPMDDVQQPEPTSVPDPVPPPPEPVAQTITPQEAQMRRVRERSPERWPEEMRERVAAGTWPPPQPEPTEELSEWARNIMAEERQTTTPAVSPTNQAYHDPTTQLETPTSQEPVQPPAEAAPARR